MHRLLALVVTLGLGGCGLLSPPGWIESPPHQDGWIHAVGSAGVTFDNNPARSEAMALERALRELATQISVQVTASTLLSESNTGSRLRAETHTFSDEELKWVQIRKKWVDRDGKLGDPGRVYVLIRMSDSDARKTRLGRG